MTNTNAIIKEPCIINTNREAYYRDLALAEIDAIVYAGPDYLWLVTSGFQNADDCCPDGSAGQEGWNGGGYWEFVYTSITSNLEDYVNRRAFGSSRLVGILSDYRYDRPLPVIWDYIPHQ